MDLNEVAIFIKVIQAGSFSLAAHQLGMPNSTVSSKISSLEKRLGITLINRTTRKLSITPAGQVYFNRCIQGLHEFEVAEVEITATQSEPQGLLRLTAPTELGSSVLPNLIAEYLKKYEKVQIELILADRRIDLVSENIDLALRAGVLKDSSLLAKKLGSVFFAPFASAKYIKTHGSPQHPRDLKLHQTLQFTALGSKDWKLSNGHGSISAATSSRVLINDMNTIKSLVLSDGGIALLPTFFCYPEVIAGKLVRLLPDWKSDLNPIHFVYPAQKFVSLKLSSFIRFTSEKIKESLGRFTDI